MMKAVAQYIAGLTRITVLSVTVVAAWAAVISQSQGVDGKDEPIKQVMKTYHKAPKGIDPVCKKASDGKASSEEIKQLVVAYKTLVSAKPPKGEDASWKEKTSKLLAAAEAMQKGEPDGVTKYKEAVNCKACHSIHRAN